MSSHKHIHALLETTGPSNGRKIYIKELDYYNFSGNISLLEYHGTKYVIKQTRSAKVEYRKYLELRGRLGSQSLTDGVSLADLSFFETNNTQNIVSKYYGLSLSSSFPRKYSVDYFVHLLDILRDRGVKFSGLLPRNILYNGTSLVLIDFEDLKFMDTTSFTFTSLELVKFIIAWSRYFDYSNIYYVLQKHNWVPIGNDTDPLDSFESCAKELFMISSDEDVRNKCNVATFISENEFDNTKIKKHFTKADLGHFVDDILPQPISVLYTFSLARLLAENKPGANKLLRSLKRLTFGAKTLNILPQKLAVQCTIEIVSAAATLTPLCANLRWVLFQYKLLKLCPIKNVHWALCYSSVVEEIVHLIYSTVIQVFDLEEKEFALLLRGSLAQKIMTPKSDVDFEISSSTYVNGIPELESLLICILSQFGIDAEGSNGRPEEVDFIGKTNTTRDLHELLELRQIMCHIRSNHWVVREFDCVLPSDFLKYSTYEKENKEINAKFVLLKIRTLIARLGAQQHLRYILPLDILKALAADPCHRKIAKLFRILSRAYSFCIRRTVAPDMIHDLYSEICVLENEIGITQES